MAQVYEVPVLYSELRPAESYVQIHDTLRSLEHVVTEVFNRVLGRVQSEKERLDGVRKRVDTADQKISLVAGSTRATTVHSPARYPGVDIVPDLEPVFRRPERPSVQWSHVPRAAATQTVTPIGRAASDVILVENTKQARTPTAAEGLGRLPAQVSSISELLLFNSRDNPYRSYITIDNLQGSEGERRTLARRKELVAAPPTVLQGEEIQVFGQLDFSYRPAPGNVPRFELPSMLPELPGVADLTWSAQASVLPIAPSHVQALLPTLPTVDEVKPAMPELPTVASSGPPPPPPAADTAGAAKRAGPPPPPPPPPPPAGGDAPAAKRGGPPPPPPPPPPPAGEPSQPPGGSDDAGRSALLESIRNPGIKLRKVGESADGSGGAPEVKKKPKTFMSVVEEVVSLRRKAMLGGAQPSHADDADHGDGDLAPLPLPRAAPAAPPAAPAPRRDMAATAPLTAPKPPPAPPAAPTAPAAPAPPPPPPPAPVIDASEALKGLSGLSRLIAQTVPSRPPPSDDGEWDD